MEKHLTSYKSHKIVKATQIADIINGDDKDFIEVIGETLIPFKVSRQWVVKHDPQIGGYFIKYQDGYESFSPSEPFENGYSKTTCVEYKTIYSKTPYEFDVKLSEHVNNGWTPYMNQYAFGDKMCQQLMR